MKKRLWQIFLGMMIFLGLASGCQDKEKKEAISNAKIYLQTYYQMAQKGSPSISPLEVASINPQKKGSYEGKSSFLLQKVFSLKPIISENHLQLLLYGQDIQNLSARQKLLKEDLTVGDIKIKITSHNRVEKTMALQYQMTLISEGKTKRELEHEGTLLLIQEEDKWRIDKNKNPKPKDAQYEEMVATLKKQKIETAKEKAQAYLKTYYQVPFSEEMGKISDEELKPLVPALMYEHYRQYAPPFIKEGYRILRDVEAFCTESFFESLKNQQDVAILVDNAVKTKRRIQLSEVTFEVVQYDEQIDTISFQYEARILFEHQEEGDSAFILSGRIHLVELIDGVWLVKGESQGKIEDEVYLKAIGKK